MNTQINMKASNLEGLKGLYSVCCVVKRVKVELQILLQKCGILVDSLVEGVHSLTPVNVRQFHRFLSAGYLTFYLATFLRITGRLSTVILHITSYLRQLSG